MMSRHKYSSPGFTLTELLLSVVVTGMVVIVAGESLLTHIRTGIRMEDLERQRSDWSRTTFFLDAEVALSQEVYIGTDLLALPVPPECGNLGPGNLKLALRIRPDLPLVFYSLKDSEAPWLPTKSLYRCGPTINEDGTYNGSNITYGLLVDGLGVQGLEIDSSSKNPPSLNYTLAIKGSALNAYSQKTGSSGRTSPSYIRPDKSRVCTSLIPPVGSSEASDNNEVICNGANGTSKNTILEYYNASTVSLSDQGGNNRLVGTSGADTLSAGEGDDVFLGFGGNDTLNGGNGYNRYVPDAGNDIINGGSGVDAVFFTGNKSLFSLSSSCSKVSCTVSSSKEGTDTLRQVDVLVFDDQIQFLD